MRALSVRQPYAELILRGNKVIEFRTKPTNIRERVYLYVSKHPSGPEIWEGLDFTADDVPTGIIVGTVEIANCGRIPHEDKEKFGLDRSIFPEDDEVVYGWLLEAPRRLKRTLKPEGHPQPIWFNPFPK
jgi:hypothetical protein